MSKPKYTKAQVCAALLAASTKMAENPDMIVAGNLAEDETGRMLAPNDPKACKFCALGFVARELNSSEEWTTQFIDDLTPAGFARQSLRNVFTANDFGVVEGDKLRGQRKLVELAEMECKTNDDAG